MQEHQPEIAQFVESLWHAKETDRSLARRAYTAYFITAHRPEIEQYIDRHVCECGASSDMFRWARKTRRILKQNEKGPKGYHFDPRTGSLVGAYQNLPYASFRIYKSKGKSLEHYRAFRLLRMAGMLFILSTLSLLFLGGWQLYRTAGSMVEAWLLLLEHYMQI